MKRKFLDENEKSYKIEKLESNDKIFKKFANNEEFNLSLDFELENEFESEFFYQEKVENMNKVEYKNKTEKYVMNEFLDKERDNEKENMEKNLKNKKEININLNELKYLSPNSRHSPSLFPPLKVAKILINDEKMNDDFINFDNEIDDEFLNFEEFDKNDIYNIKYPENLISVTSIINGIECVRKSNIMEYFSTGGVAKNKYYIIGSLVHRIFQFRLYQLSSTYSTDIKNKLATKEDIHKLVIQILKTNDYIIDMYVGDIDENEIMKEIETYYESIIKWSDILLGKKLFPIEIETETEIEIYNELMKNKEKKSNVCDIEEVISSKKYGIKGNVDVTCLIENKLILPIELKSSRSYGKYGRSEHRAQLLLYQLVLSEIYNQKIENGLLLYLRDNGNAIRVKFLEQEAIHLFNIRNEIASFPYDKKLGDYAMQNVCNRCEFIDTCKLIGKLNKDIIPEHLKTLSNNIELIPLSYINFYDKWKKIIHQLMLEEMQESKIVLKTDTENLLLFPYKLKVISCNSLDLGKKYTFKCSIVKSFSFENQKLQLAKNQKILKTFIVGDYVILRSLGMIQNTWKCNIQKIDSKFIILGSFRPLPNKKFGKLFTLEKMFHSINFKTENQVLLNFILDKNEHIENLRKLLILDKNPTFENILSNEIKLLIESYTKNLNKDQINAIEKCLKSNFYSLIWGLPGTGKTTTIAAFVHILSKLKKKVLIVSNTNNSVDNILFKLLDKRIDFLRVGPSNRIKEELQSYVLSNIVSGYSLESFKIMIENKLVIATTCSSLSNNIFLKINYFDYCIIDEATQVLFLNLIPALIMSKKFILVGDHKQLPPIIKSNHPIMNEAKISIFEKLFNKFPQVVSALTIQYRMPNDIANICSNVFYNGAMTCNENNITNLIEWNKQFKNLRNNYIFDEWIYNVLDNKSSSAIFVETSNLNKYENSQNQEELTNIYIEEANAVLKIIKALKECKIDVTNNIAIITQFKKQMELIENLCNTIDKNIQVHTIDRFQGCEKDVIIVSFAVKLNNKNGLFKVSHLTCNRLNVALTRPKKKLIMFGCSEFLIQHSIEFSKIIKILKSKNAIVNI